MGILIADSGATKTEWGLKTVKGMEIFKTEGLNPYYHTTQSIKDVITHSLQGKLPAVTITHIYFYGAGCDTKDKEQKVSQILEQSFKGTKIELHHDLLGAARACFLNQQGIACILGTGSNSCLYDGTEVIEHIPSLAFILGDEGSAGYFGKKLINKYYRYELPQELQKALEENYNMSLDHISNGLYDSPQKSRFIASYGAFLGEHDEHPFIKEMLYEGFENFITRIVMKYSNAVDYEVRFIGSVAYAYQDMIEEILQKHGMKAGLFVQKPMERLAEFHSLKVH